MNTELINRLNCAKEALLKPEITAEDIERARKDFAPFMIEGYEITPKRVHSAANTIRRFNRMLLGEYGMEAFGESAKMINQLRKVVPSLESYLLYHFVGGSTPHPRMCHYFDLDENPEIGLFGKLCSIELIYEILEGEHTNKIKNGHFKR